MFREVMSRYIISNEDGFYDISGIFIEYFQKTIH